jgi:hypothetical protein
MTVIRAKHLTTFSVAPDGSNVAIGVADEDGQAAALMLPAECLRALIMTLPDMMRRALRLQPVIQVCGWSTRSQAGKLSVARVRNYVLSRCARPTAFMSPLR